MKLRVKLFGKNVFIGELPLSKKVYAEDYYRMVVDCKNCKSTTIIFVKKGVFVNDIVTKVKCQYCNCKLEKQEK